jgi:phytoene desaturase
VILFKVMRGDRAPAQQVRPGYDLPIQTPVANLLEVGDGVKPYGWIGTTACAETARIAVNTLLFNQPIGSHTGGGQ